MAHSHNMLDAIPVMQPLPISVLFLSFQYFIFGIADMFTFVGLLEFFYSQAPKGLKSISSCFLWSSMSLGYFLSTIMVKIVNAVTERTTSSRGWLGGNNINRSHLNLFYWLLSILSLINFFIYLCVAKRYNYRLETLKVTDENSKGFKSVRTNLEGSFWIYILCTVYLLHIVEDFCSNLVALTIENKNNL